MSRLDLAIEQMVVARNYTKRLLDLHRRIRLVSPAGWRGDAHRWCAQHEAVHAGQIGLLRRVLGYKPIW